MFNSNLYLNLMILSVVFIVNNILEREEFLSLHTALYRWREEIRLFQKWSARYPAKWSTRCRRSGVSASGNCIWHSGSPGTRCGMHPWTGLFYRATRNISRRRKRILKQFRINVKSPFPPLLLFPPWTMIPMRIPANWDMAEKWSWRNYSIWKDSYVLHRCMTSEARSCTIFFPCVEIN